MAEAVTVHAGAVLIAECGILIMGPAGAGKSSLAGDLIRDARNAGLLARLVSDDRTRLSAHHGRLVAAPVPGIAGMMEVRGAGIVSLTSEPAAVVRSVIELVLGEIPRFPEGQETKISLCGVVVPRFWGKNGAFSTSYVLGLLRGFHNTVMTG